MMNFFGLLIVAVIMVPNVIFAMRGENPENKYHNKAVEIIEQAGRFGSMAFMVFNLPVAEFGFWFPHGNIVHMAVAGVLAVLYCLVWIFYFREANYQKAMLLAIIPTIIFFSSGVIQGKPLLIITSILFGIGHITITYKNYA